MLNNSEDSHQNLGNVERELTPFEKDVVEILEESVHFCIFLDPVIIDCGHTIDKTSFDNIRTLGNSCCPICRTRSTEMIRNFFAKQIIGSFLDHYPNYLKFQASSKEQVCKLVQANQIQDVLELVQKSPEEVISSSLPDGTTVLHAAVDKNNVVLIKALIIMQGIQINAKDNAGRTPLHKAVSNIEIINLLIANGANPNAQTEDGSTPLHLAAKGDNPEAIVSLANKSNINLQLVSGQCKGWTPLHIAIASNKEKIIDVLLSVGADINVKAEDGKTPGQSHLISSC